MVSCLISPAMSQQLTVASCCKCSPEYYGGSFVNFLLVHLPLLTAYRKQP